MALGFLDTLEDHKHTFHFDSDHELQEREVLIAVPTRAHFIPSLNFIIKKYGKKAR